jgi:hypothetical protein
MKKIVPHIFAVIVLLVSSLYAPAQVDSGNRPVGNLVYAADGYIYGAYTKTTVAGYRPSTIYRYLPGAATVDPIFRIDDHVVEVHVVDDDGFIYGTAIQYNSSSQPIYSRIFRVKNDGTGYTILYNNNATTAGIHYSLILVAGSLYGIRSGGGWSGHGIVFSMGRSGEGYWTVNNFSTAIQRPTTLLTHIAWQDGDYGNKGDQVGFWNATTFGGTFGKGTVEGGSLYGEPIVPRIDFSGQGAGPLDGQGPISIVNDHDTDVYAITQRGGVNNEGALFVLGADGYQKLHDFTAVSGQPFGTPFVEFEEGKLVGLGGNFMNNTGFIYSYSPQTDTYSNVAVFGASSAVNGITSIVVPHNGVIYGTSRSTGSDSENGSLFAINQDGTGTQVIFKFVDGYSRLVDPANNQLEVSVTPSLRAYNGLNGVTNSASSYRIEVSENSDFTGTVHVVNTPDGVGKINPPGLKYSTKYYARVKTNLIDDFGLVTSFKTHAPEKYSFVGTPANGATNVPLNGVKATANIVYGATLYTIELNTSADFTGTSLVKTSAAPNQRTLIFDGLQPATTYYTRVKTNYPSNWGPTRSFTTVGASPPPVFIAEANEPKVYPNPFEHNFTIEPNDFEVVQVSLVDLTGKELVKMQVTQQPATLGDQLAPGTYFLRINTNGRTSVKRMVKK